MTKVMIFTIHGTTPWWSYLASRLHVAQETVVVSDLRGDGDISVVDAFYRHLRSQDSRQPALAAFGPEGCDDIVLRCRTLRSLDRDRALRMIGAMWLALDEVLEAERPDLVLTFTIDRYVMDLLERAARRRGITFVEMTTSVLADQVMFMNRGRLFLLREPSEEEVAQGEQILGRPDFAPTYVRDATRFGWLHYWRVFAYFELRGMAFNALRWLRRDPLNLHYLDAQKSLKHKVRLHDYRVLRHLHPHTHVAAAASNSLVKFNQMSSDFHIKH